LASVFMSCSNLLTGCFFGACSLPFSGCIETEIQSILKCSEDGTINILLLDFLTLSIGLHSKQYTMFWKFGSIRSLQLVSEMLCSVWNRRQWKKFRSPVILSYINFPSKDLVLHAYMVCLFCGQEYYRSRNFKCIWICSHDCSSLRLMYMRIPFHQRE
jgi:hypothetical protein